MKTKQTSSSAKDTKSIPVWNGTNYSFPKFDRGVMTWARVKWNGELGRALWENTFPDELFEIPETAGEWLKHCEMIHRFNKLSDFKTSKLLYADPEF